VAENALVTVDEANMTAAPRAVLTNLEETIRRNVDFRNDPKEIVRRVQMRFNLYTIQVLQHKIVIILLKCCVAIVHDHPSKTSRTLYVRCILVSLVP
jgi:hypothetical protein